MDQDAIRHELGTGRRVIPFLEQDGKYYGLPQDDATAIRELERLRGTGAKFIVFWWADFWWLEYYTSFNQYLRSRYRCVLEDDSVIIFDVSKASEDSQ